MQKKSISQGAEAIIYLDKKNNLLIKERISKEYRIKEIDEKIIKRRTKSEIKILKKLKGVLDVPEVYESSKENKINMEFIDGERLSKTLGFYELKKQKKICFEIGKIIAKMHQKNIIHGDLTTSNMILKKTKTYLIDFGLGFQNGKYEDKAVDLHLFKQALEAKHFRNWKEIYNEFQKGYSLINKQESEKVFNQLIKVEKRGRYKH